MTVLSSVYTPFIKFQIGDIDLTYNPQKHIISATITRTAKTFNNANVVLYDDEAIYVENLLTRDRVKEDIYLQYGFSFFRESPIMKMSLVDYTIEFTAGRARLTMDLVTIAMSSLGIPRRRTYVEKTPSEIVREIARIEGWDIGYIEDTIPVYEDGKIKSYRQENISSIKFIKDILIKESVSATTKASNYNLFFIDKNGRTYVYYCTNQFGKKPSARYEYEIYSKDNNEVISFSCSPEGKARAYALGDIIKGYGYDPLVREHYIIEYDYRTNTSKVVTGPKINNYESEKGYDLGIKPIEVAKKEIAKKWYEVSDTSYEATLEILGNPILMPQETISIIVYDKNGRPHHTSGIYLITEIEDTIEGGNFTSTCSLIRNASNYGNEISVGRRNY